MSLVHRGPQVSRRTVLRGVGAAVGLPLLDAMVSAVPAFAGTGDDPAASRLVVVYAPNGKHMADWTPSAEGDTFAMPYLLEPLEPLRKQIAVWSGLTADGARAHGDGPGDHARAAGAFLTGTHPRKTGGADLKAGVSLDQIVAAKIGQGTDLPSLELGLEGGRPSGECDSGYSCAYSNNLAWRSESSPLAKEVNPQQVFDRLFADAGATDAQREQRRAERRSVLDFALDDAKRLDAKLGASDRRKLDEYLTAVRDLEQRIDRAAAAGAPGAAISGGVPRPAGVPADHREHVRVMYDLVVMAFRADRTRVVTLMLGNEGSNRSYAFLGVPEGHHDLSHHGGDAAKQAKIRTINRFQMEEFAAFLARLKAAREDDGQAGGASLLDRSIVIYGSAISDGNAHDHGNLPILVAGGRAGPRTGFHRRVPKETPLANLYLSVLDHLNVRVTTFGDATGRLTGA
ncbi:MAG: DUF1552 domain-containing protein [Planctomycetes bacterium]|nr:DUF1552 domain-containing protein [Planctomycetota bacterium]